MSLDWDQLIDERNEWVAKNFPSYEGEIPGRDSILGCFEELGELAHAHLKEKQGIRGTKEEHVAAGKDAIGDLIVYLLGVMEAAGCKPNPQYLPPEYRRPQDHEQALLRLGLSVGRLGGPASPRPTIDRIVYYARAYCTLRYWDFDDIVQATWDHVKNRDWNAHREAGAPARDPAMDDPGTKTGRFSVSGPNE